MTRKLFACGLLIAAGGAAVVRAELPRHTARPFALAGIPCYDYKAAASQAPAPTVTALSLTKVAAVPDPLPAAPVVVGGTAFAVEAARTAPQPLLFQMLETKLQADHCVLSRVAVAFHPDGAYQISFRADQNPQPSSDFRSPLKAGETLTTTIQTSHLKRNLFVVKVRGYASYPARGTQPGRGITPPALVEFALDPFWVQQGSPHSGFFTGRSDAVRQYYGVIDRVEVEFTYR